jgi:hypothetical protein
MAGIYHDTRSRRRILIRVAVAIVCLGVTSSESHAAVTLTGEEEVIIQSHEVIEDDLIVWAPYVRVDGVVKGDLVALGEEIVVEGIVEQDLHAVGKTVYLNGAVNDDARIAAYAIAFGDAARVGDDVFQLSYSLETKPGAQVGGTLHAASKQALLAGSIVEDLLLRAGALELRGLVGGDVRAVVGGLEGVTHSQLAIDLSLEIPFVDDGIRVASSAAIGGVLAHRSLGPATVESGATITGGVEHEAWRVSASSPIGLARLEEEDSFFAGETGSFVERVSVLIGIGLLLAVAVPGWFMGRGEHVRGEPAGLLGWGIGTLVFGGVAAFVVGVVSFVLLAISLGAGAGGLAVSAMLAGGLLQLALFALFGVAVFFLAPALACAGIGGALLSRFQVIGDGDARATDAMLAAAVGALVYAIVRAIPFLGLLFGLGATLVGLGALALWLRAVFVESEPV